MSNPVQSIEYNCEEVILQKLIADPRFASQDVRHWDSASRALIETVVIKCEKRDHQLEGVEGWGGTITINFSSGKLTPEEADGVANVIGEVIYAADPDFFDLVPTLVPDLLFFSLEPESTTSRIDTKKLRKRIVTAPVIAKLNL